MKKPKSLHHRLLRQKLNVRQLNFKTTAELEFLAEFVGQSRALEAVSFGIGIKFEGYNLYAMGPSGIGKRSLIRTVLENEAKKGSTPSDWCYIYNFKNPDKPIALSLPPGIGSVLQHDMKNLIEELSTSILAVFESDEYRTQMHAIYEDFILKRSKVIKKDVDQDEVKIPHLYKERHAKEKELQLKFTSSVVQPLIQK